MERIKSKKARSFIESSRRVKPMYEWDCIQAVIIAEQEMLEHYESMIAAAPELLEALQKTNKLLGPLTNKHTGDDKYRDFVIQYAENIEVITKALGE